MKPRKEFHIKNQQKFITQFSHRCRLLNSCLLKRELMYLRLTQGETTQTCVAESAA